MKIRHFALLILILVTIVFLQPLVLLMGNLALLGGVLAFIYSDLPSESQQAWDNRISGFLKQLRTSLKNRTKRVVRPPDSTGLDDRSRTKLREQASDRLEQGFGHPEPAAQSSRKDNV